MAKSVFEGASNSGDNWDSLSGAVGAASAGEKITISGSWTAPDTTPVVVNKDDITITILSNAVHSGFNNDADNHYRLEVSDGNHCIEVTNTGCTIQGLVIKQASTTTSAEGIRNSTDGLLTVKHCIIWSDTATSQQDGIYNATDSAFIIVESTIIYGFSRGGITDQSLNTIWAINGCTIYSLAAEIGGGCVVNQNNPSTFRIFNTIMLRDTGLSGTFCCSDFSGGTWDIHDSIADDSSILTRDGAAVGALQFRVATDNTSPGVGSWVMFNDITSIASYDLHLQDHAENDAVEAHSNIGGADLFVFTSDIDVQTRISPYSIGADQLVTTNTITLVADSGTLVFGGDSATLISLRNSEKATTWFNQETWKSPTFGDAGAWFALATKIITLNAESSTLIFGGDSATLTKGQGTITLEAASSTLVFGGDSATLTHIIDTAEDNEIKVIDMIVGRGRRDPNRRDPND